MLENEAKFISEPLVKLLDVVSNGISALAAPWMYKRMERAKLFIAQESAAQVRNTMIQDALAEQLKDDILSGRDRREWKNIADVIGVSANLLSAVSAVSEKPISPDWAARFFDSVKNCSDEEIKNLWSQILAGEIICPGSFSLRTLDILRNMSRADAELIVKYANRVVGNDFIELGVSVLDLAALGDIGFINDNSLIRYINIGEDLRAVAYSNNNHVLVIQGSTKNQQVKYDFHALTQPGREIIPLITVEEDDEFLHQYAEKMKRSFPSLVSVSKHEIIKREGSTFTYKTDPIWAV